MIRGAFFISPAGEVIPVPGSHISMIIRDPDRFGLTKDTIEAMYRKYHEPLGLEGEARSRIIVKVIQSGWGRIRRYRNHWSVNVWELSFSRRHLHTWASSILQGIDGVREKDPYIPVHIVSPEGREVDTIIHFSQITQYRDNAPFRSGLTGHYVPPVTSDSHDSSEVAERSRIANT